MRSIPFFVSACLILLVGCAPVQYTTVQPKATVQSQFELSIVDVNGNPLDGVTVEYTLEENGEFVKRGLFTTASDGLFIENLESRPLSKSELKFTASKEGYYDKNGSMSSVCGMYYDGSSPIETKTITLIRPVDYFGNRFTSSLSDVQLRTNILKFIDLLILQGLVSHSVLETKSINVVPFKNNKYLQFEFKNTNVYNSLRLTKYDIGKMMFDEVVRKILTPLNEHIGSCNLFYGYDIKIISYTKSFADEYAMAKPVEYSFMIPEKTVSKYKNKDISGQQVLDASIILMDDERIELKLQ